MHTRKIALAAFSTLVLSGAAHATMPAPVPVFPAGMTVFGTFSLQWTAVSGATWYRVWVSQGGSAPNLLPCAFNHGSVDPGGCWIQGTALTLPTPLPAGNYLWWVKAWSPQQDGGWSAGMRFSVSTTRFEDRGLTVFDYQTQLEWEKKTNDGSIHDVNKTYTWSGSAASGPDGTLFTTFLAVLNLTACTGQSADGVTVTGESCQVGFASENDWRLPGIDELRTIVDCSQGTSCLDPVFGPTNASSYWSSSSSASLADEAWLLSFADGSASADVKTNSSFARAVRSDPIVDPGGGGCTRTIGGTVVLLPGVRWCLEATLVNSMPPPK